MTTEYAIKFDKLQFCWQADTPAININQWEVKAGNRVFLQGSSGSGKSTLLNLIAGLLTASTGSLQVLGKELTALSSYQRDQFRARHIGVIFQQFNLIPYLSVSDNIKLGAQFTNKQAIDTSLETLCEQLQLATDLLNRPASKLSIGQQQRVAVARALYNQPEIIIADEPTSALDSDNRDQFIELLLEHSRTSQATVLFVSHDNSLAHHFDEQIHIQDINHVS